jgi:hypothetical protein
MTEMPCSAEDEAGLAPGNRWIASCDEENAMKRDTLAAFFRRAVIAALPLVGGCDATAISVNGDGGQDLASFLGRCAQPRIVDGGLDDGGCIARCAGGSINCEASTNDGGGEVTICYPGCTGRRPEGLARRSFSGSSLGRHFARMAHLEAASVPAFRRLRAELRRHGAPRRLLDACTRAARDEVRHARAAARLARRFGARVPRVKLAPAQARTLLELAVENVREGCVRESFGALLLTWQARTAGDGVVRQIAASLAADETRHAELAWQIDAWARTRLSQRERARLRRVRRDELAAVARQLEGDGDGALVEVAGLPPPVAARALYRAFAARVTGAA